MAITYSKYEEDTFTANTSYASTFTLNSGTNRLILAIQCEVDVTVTDKIYKIQFDGQYMKPLGMPNPRGAVSTPSMWYLSEATPFTDSGAGGSVNYTATPGASSVATIMFIQFNGVDATYPIESILSRDLDYNATASASEIELNNHTHSSNAMVVHIANIQSSVNTFTGYTAGSGFTEIYDIDANQQSTNNGKYRFGACYQSIVSPVATTNCKMTANTTGESMYVSTITLKDATSSYLTSSKTSKQKEIEFSSRRFKA